MVMRPTDYAKVHLNNAKTFADRMGNAKNDKSIGKHRVQPLTCLRTRWKTVDGASCRLYSARNDRQTTRPAGAAYGTVTEPDQRLG